MSRQAIGDDRRAFRWACPVCGSTRSAPRFPRATVARGTAGSFRPSSGHYGMTSGHVRRCLACGHAAVADALRGDDLMTGYAEAEDTLSLREEDGQVETAVRALTRIERYVAPGSMVDLGCWTGSFAVAAQRRGWKPVGIEPSTWAANRARERGVEVVAEDLFAHGLPRCAFQLVVLCDVLEHLVEPGAAVEQICELVAPGGCFYVTVPDAGSALARLLGRHWWSVLPMHLQYFTRGTVARLLGSRGFRILEMRTHAKVFSGRYYAERLGGYSPLLGRLAVASVSRVGIADRMVAPDFRDRIAVIAIRDRD